MKFIREIFKKIKEIFSLKVFFDFLKNKFNNINYSIFLKRVIWLLVLTLIFGYGYKRFIYKEELKTKSRAYSVEMVSSDEIILPVKPIDTLNPLLSKSEDVFYISHLTYSRLFYLDETMTPRNDLTESYSFNGNKLSIKLKEAKWDFGDSVLAEDVIFTFNAIKQIGDEGVYSKVYKNIKSIYGSGRDIEITFNDSDKISLTYLDFPIMPHRKFRGYTELASQKDNFVIYSSGKYIAGRWNSFSGMNLEANPNYYGAKAKNNIRIIAIKNDSNLINLLESGIVTSLFVKGDKALANTNKNSIKEEKVKSNNLEFIGFNTKTLPSKELRKGILTTIDLEEVIKKSYNHKLINKGIYMKGYMESSYEPSYKFNIDNARKLLKKAGFSDKNTRGKFQNEKEEVLRLQILVDEEKNERVKLAEEMYKYIQKAGIEVEIKAMSKEDYKEALSKGEFDIFIGGIFLDKDMDFRELLSTGGKYNFTGYGNQSVDDNLNKLFQGVSLDESKKIVQEIEKSIEDDGIYTCICYKEYGILKAKGLTGEVIANFINPYLNIENWNVSVEKRIENQEN